MPKEGITVQLSVRDIYKQLCPQCRIKLRELIRANVSEKMVSQVIGE